MELGYPNHVEASYIPANSDRCNLLTATFCIVISTISFFGSVITIVWVYEHKVVPYKYALVCYMVGSGLLYIMAFTSSLLLLTRELPKRSRSIQREEPNIGLTGCDQNNGGCEAASDISYREGDQLLQVPQMANAKKTPPPPYRVLSGTPTSQGDMGRVQPTEILNNTDDSPDRFYFVLNRDEVQGRDRTLQQEHMASGFDAEMQTMRVSDSIIRSSNNSYPVTKALRQQISNSSLRIIKQNGNSREVLHEPTGKSKLQASTSFENSPKSALKAKNPSQSIKQKVIHELLISPPDLPSKESRNTRSNLNSESTHQESLQSNLKIQGSPRILKSNPEVLTSLSNLSHHGTPRLSRFNTEIRTAPSNLSLEEKQRTSRPDCNEEIVSSQSSSSFHGTPRISRFISEGRTSRTNLNLQGTAEVSRSTAEVRTSQSILCSEGKLQYSRSNENEETSSLSNLKPEGTPIISRFNIARTSQMHLNTEAILKTSQYSLSVDRKRSSSDLNPGSRKQQSLSNLIAEQKQMDSKSNYLVPTDRGFISHSNLHLGTQQSDPNANSNGLQRAPQVDMNSNASLNTSYSNMDDADLKHTSQPVKKFQKLLKPQQLVACSKNVPMLQKAQSFTSLSVAHPVKEVSMENASKMSYEEHPPNTSSSRQMSGRSIESVLDATRNTKQMTPEEWMTAWNHGSRKLPVKEAERIVGVRI